MAPGGSVAWCELPNAASALYRRVQWARVLWPSGRETTQAVVVLVTMTRLEEAEAPYPDRLRAAKEATAGAMLREATARVERVAAAGWWVRPTRHGQRARRIARLEWVA